MDTQALIDEVKTRVKAGAISEKQIQDIAMLFEQKEKKSGGLVSTVLYFSGAAIVLIGFVVFFGQNWDKFSSAVRILVTLGFGILFLISGLFLRRSGQLHYVPTALQMIAGVLIPIGAFVMLYELGFRGGGWGTTIIFMTLTIIYAALANLERATVFALFAIIYGTIATLFAVDALIGTAPIFEEYRLFMYQTLSVGFAYVFLARGGKGVASLSRLVPWLYAAGAFLVLLSTFVLGGWQPEQSAFWELLYLPIIFCVMYFAVYVRSRAVLVFSAVGLVGFLFKITSEYFSDWLSWPILLILAGFVVMGVGYLTYYINKKYLSVAS